MVDAEDPKPQPLWKRYFWINTATNYVRTIIRLATGLVLFRLLFSGLDSNEFGFWSLLWSLFGYGVLLDFGFGFTAQKAVAEKTATGDMPGLSRLLSTMFWTFVLLALGVGCFFFLIADWFLSPLGLPDHDQGKYYTSYFIFFAGLALTFPFGLFPEMLRGLQRIYLANAVNTASTLLNFIGIALALYWGAAFEWIVLISVATTLLPNLVAAALALRLLRGVSLNPRHFHWGSVKSQMGFSIAAYLITFSNLLMSKSDQLVIGLCLGVGAVTLYQAGYKVAEMLNLFTIQLQDALSPAAASMNAEGDREGLRELLLKTSRLTFLVTTPLYLLCAVYLDPLIRLLTGLEKVPGETYWSGQILLLAIFSSQLTNSCSKRILMMCGYEKKLLSIALIDGLANLGISIALALTLGIFGVALGTLLPTALVGWLWVLPLTLAYLDLKLTKYFLFWIQGTWFPLGVFGFLLLILEGFFPIGPDSGFLDLLWRGVACGGPWLLLSAKTLLATRR